MNEITTDLSKFGARERAMAAELLTASNKGFPRDFNDDGVTVMMNTRSGNVFLTNSDLQVAMMTGPENARELESFYSCPECGHEGFFDEIKDASEHGDGRRAECRRWIKDVKGGR